MKAGFFIVLILLLAAAGTGFYFGWVQIQLPEQTYGVIFTKTGGWDDRPVEPGTFSWRWEGLIPTNMKLHRIPVRPQNVRVSREGSLPSSDVYSTVLDEGDFSYSLDFTLTYELKPEFLPELVRDRGLDPASMDEWYGGINNQILSSVSRILAEEFEELGNLDEEEFSTAGLEEVLLEELAGDFPFIDFNAVQPREMSIPDMDLYMAAKSYYLGVLETRESIEQETLEQDRAWMVSEESKLGVLERYGKIFTEYPGLIEYFALRETGEFRELLPSIDLIQGEAGSAGSEQQGSAGPEQQSPAQQ